MNRLAAISLTLLGALLMTAVTVPAVWPQVVPYIEPVKKAGTQVLLITETNPSDDDYTAAAATIRSSDQYFAGYGARGLSYRPYDQHSDDLGPKLKAKLAEFKVPVLAILDDSGEIVWIGACPLTVKEFDAKVKEVTGK